MSAIPAASVHADAGDERDLVLRFGDGPAIGVQLISLTQTGALTLSRMVEAGLPRETAGVPRVYATPALRTTLRDRMASARLSWIELGGGAVHLDLGSYYIHDVTTHGRPAAATPEAELRAGRQRGGGRPVKLVGRSGGCAEAVILWWMVARRQPSLLPPLTQTTLAEVSGVTAALAGRVLHRLEALGALVPDRIGKRTSSWKIENVEKILQAWVDEDRKPVRVTRAYVYARHSGELHEKLARLTDASDAWALGGVAAANQYAPTMTADPLPTVWIRDSSHARNAAKAIGGELVMDGANVVFWQTPKDPWATFCNGCRHGPLSERSELAAVSPARPSPAPHTRVRAFMTALELEWSERTPARQAHMVSPVRALQETLQDDRGRSDQVALALSDRLELTRVPLPPL